MAKPRGNILAVVGAQYGSEGKGVIVNHLANRFGLHLRVGGPNAGHSINHRGQVYKMQAIPCGWTNREADLLIGRGALVSMETMCREIEMIRRIDPSILTRLKVDRRAGVISPRHHEEEGGVSGEIHKRIGSTGEGVGAARLDRIKRNAAGFHLVEDVADRYHGPGWRFEQFLIDSVAEWVEATVGGGTHCLLEGTQGSGLSLIHGPWPYVTSADTNAAQMAADVGISPRHVNRVMLVVRSHPIRVAGNSGPLRNEITWAQLSKELGINVEEKTTVTKKIRRVGRWDEDLFMQAVLLNGPTSLALSFADYIDPSIAGVRMWSKVSAKVKDFVTYLERISNVPVALIGTGGPTWSVVDLGKAV